MLHVYEGWRHEDTSKLAFLRVRPWTNENEYNLVFIYAVYFWFREYTVRLDIRLRDISSILNLNLEACIYE